MSAFLYKILHCVSVKDSVSYKWKIVDSLSFTFCYTEIETIEHIFIECNVIHQYGKSYLSFILYNTGITLSIEKSDIMLKKPRVSCILEGKILAYIKCYIYVTKFK